jgi:hypothetical protein
MVSAMGLLPRWSQIFIYEVIMAIISQFPMVIGYIHNSIVIKPENVTTLNTPASLNALRPWLEKKRYASFKWILDLYHDLLEIDPTMERVGSSQQLVWIICKYCCCLYNNDSSEQPVINLLQDEDIKKTHSDKCCKICHNLCGKWNTYEYETGEILNNDGFVRQLCFSCILPNLIRPYKVSQNNEANLFCKTFYCKKE